MKSCKKSFLLIFMFSLFFQQIFAATGTALCNKIFEYLEEKDFAPQVQPLIANGTNNLPYNIIVSFHDKDTKTRNNLILFFETSDFEDRLESLNTILSHLKTKDFNSTLVLSYGNRINIPRQNFIYGAQTFTDSLDSTVINSAYLFNLNAEKNFIITGAENSHSPSWMLKDLFDAYSNAKMTEGLPLYFISQVQAFNYTQDKAFLSFIHSEIPCIRADIKENDKAQEVILNCIDSYEKSRFELSDSHTFMFRIFGKRVWFSEMHIIRAMIVILILSLMLVFYAGFINKNLRKEFWQEISNNWYVVPVIYLISLAGFFAGKGIYSLFYHQGSSNFTVFGFIILQICISTLLVSLFFMINLSLLKKYTTRSLDFILVVLSFINQFVFSMTDISLFPIFMIIFIISVISLVFRRNWIHIILFVFLILPFIPYVNAVFRYSQLQELHQNLLTSRVCPFLITMVLLPVYLMWLRILNAVKKRHPKKRIYALIMSCTYIFIIIALLSINKIFYSKNNNLQDSSLVVISNNNFDEDLSLAYRDKAVFSDIIRNVTISSGSAPVYTCLKILSKDNELPVLYSENDFIKHQDNTVTFDLPLYPPQKLEFNYGSKNTAQIIQAEAIFYDETSGEYYSVVKTLVTEGSK